MDVMAVANQLRRDLVGLQDRADQAGRPVPERRHPIEEMRGLPRPGLNRREPFLVARARVPQRHATPARDQPPHQVEAAIQLGGERHDADVRRGALDLGKDVGRREVGTLG